MIKIPDVRVLHLYEMSVKSKKIIIAIRATIKTAVAFNSNHSTSTLQQGKRLYLLSC